MQGCGGQRAKDYPWMPSSVSVCPHLVLLFCTLQFLLLAFVLGEREKERRVKLVFIGLSLEKAISYFSQGRRALASQREMCVLISDYFRPESTNISVGQLLQKPRMRTVEWFGYGSQNFSYLCFENYQRCHTCRH